MYPVMGSNTASDPPGCCCRTTVLETAKRSGRAAITVMLEYLKKHRATCRTILVENTDRWYRNLKDWTPLDDPRQY
jgi:hypothetical protein